MSFVSPKSQETPMENYKNYIKLMDEFTINEELQKINAIHHSLDEKNPITYAILLETNRKYFTQSQVEWIYSRIQTLKNRESRILQTSLENIDVELAMASILDKSCDYGEMRRIE
jgi:hypothetical protein